MKKINIAAIQFNATVGAVAHNCAGLFAAYEEACERGADLVVAPEFCVTGYPLEDLVLRESFLRAVDAEVNKLIERILDSGRKATFIFGAPKTVDNPPYHHGFIYNAAFFIDPADEDISVIYKQKLPNYGVFDEKRTFIPGQSSSPIEWRGLKLGLMICEDGWSRDVATSLAEQGADILISINGSPFEIGKIGVRHRIVQRRIAETGLPFLYVNSVGGQDELVFDGGAFFYDRLGNLHEGRRFLNNIEMFDAEVAPVGHHTQPHDKNPALTDQIRIHIVGDGSNDRYIPFTLPDPMEETYQALVLGLRDYLGKQGFKSVVLGYSGGVDSGLVAAIACDAIGPQNVHLVRLPSKFSSQESLDDAAEGATRLGAPMRTIDIEEVVDALRMAYRTAIMDNFGKPIMGQYDPVTGIILNLTGTSDENLQARARGTILMAISNQEGHILLSTGNKSEVSVGYCTLYGDMNGGYNVLKDCYKTLVWGLCRWRNAVAYPSLQYGFYGPAGLVVPEEIINKPPSAELRENQQDSDSLPPYPVLDFILEHLIEKELSVAEIVALVRSSDTLAPYEGEVARIRKLVDQAEYKRRQAAPGVKVTAKIHGRDRRYPIVNHWRQ